MKVGIVTFHWGYNYGAVLQAYALQQEISRLGHDVEFVNYNPFTDGRKKKFSLLSGNVFGLLKRKSRKALNKIRNRRIRKLYSHEYHRVFDQFRADFLRVSSERDIARTAYEAVVVGSDQVWNASWIGDTIYYYYLEDFRNVRKISYAACIGNDRQPEIYEAGIKKLLGEFNAVSVRNRFSYDYVAQVSGRLPEMVCDPTLLNDFAAVGSEGVKIKGLPEKFILVYALEHTLEKLGVRIVRQLKEKLRLPVVSISSVFHTGWTFNNADRIIYDASPVEWLWLLQNAAFVCTDSFHGVVFSIKNRKPFLGYRDDGWRSFRLVDLMHHYGIEKRLLADYDAKQVDVRLKGDIDYDSIEVKIENDVAASVSFLQKALQ